MMAVYEKVVVSYSPLYPLTFQWRPVTFSVHQSFDSSLIDLPNNQTGVVNANVLECYNL